MLSFQICTFLSQGATQAWDAPQDVPYAYNSQNIWVGYDNIKSFQIKVFSIYMALESKGLVKGSFGPYMVCEHMVLYLEYKVFVILSNPYRLTG